MPLNNVFVCKFIFVPLFSQLQITNSTLIRVKLNKQHFQCLVMGELGILIANAEYCQWVASLLVPFNFMSLFTL